ncbi:MAG: hypothetical protein AB7V46_04290 [Thermomicrobiales bacterium]
MQLLASAPQHCRHSPSGAGQRTSPSAHGGSVVEVVDVVVEVVVVEVVVDDGGSVH